MENKRGPWSQEEKDYIAQNHHLKTPQDLAIYLKRDVKAVEKYIKEGCHSVTYKIAKNAEYHIQNSPIWKDLERQFTKDELEMFLYHWGRVVSQFKEDVFPTEEWQIVDAVKLEILMNRTLSKQQKINIEIIWLESDLEDKLNDEPRDRNEIERIERTLAQLRGGLAGLTDEYRELLNRKNGILKEMKATRDARVKDVESSRQSWTAWMRKLIEDKDTSLRIGIDMEKMRLACKVEYERLSEYHKYDDDILDQPILNSENLIIEEDNQDG